ncbi:MAG: KH domain-containing protein, partial [Candidatus Acidiferrum sp.]
HATLHVERDSQKKILIGHKGEMLKRVGTEARKELETLLGSKIYLELFVKVVPGWRDDPTKVRELDWHSQLLGLDQQGASENAPEWGRPKSRSQQTKSPQNRSPKTRTEKRKQHKKRR